MTQNSSRRSQTMVGEQILKEVLVSVTPPPTHTHTRARTQEVSNNKVKGRRRIQKCDNDEENNGSNFKADHEK